MPTTVHMDAFLPMILPYVGACPQMIATHQLRQATIEFCEGTRLWRETITQTVTENNFAVDVPSHVSLSVIRYLSHEGKELEPAVYDDVRYSTDVGSPEFYSEPEANTVCLTPFEAGDVIMDVILKPRQGQSYGTFTGDDSDQDAYDRLPEFLHRDHGDILAHGAIGKIALIPNQEFTNPELAQYHLGQFYAGIASLSASELRHQVRPRLRTKTMWY
jgi:hypothetical protein